MDNTRYNRYVKYDYKLAVDTFVHFSLMLASHSEIKNKYYRQKMN